MANSRLQRLGTIYSRVTGLIKAGAMNPTERPLWYDIYEAFPPEKEPKIGHPAPDTPVREIFYAEDQIRAKFHKHHSDLLRPVRLNDTTNPTEAQKVISLYNKLKTEKPEESEENIFQSAVDVVKAQTPFSKSNAYQSETSANDSIVSSFTEAKKRISTSKIDIKNIFNEQ